jgi:hypothetical protein
VCGIEHNSRLNADFILQLLTDVKGKGSGPKPVLLMESLQLPVGQTTSTGSVIPYSDVLPHIGLSNAMTLLQEPVFASQLTGEVVAVVQALKLGMDIIFCDRLNTVSIDILLSRYSVTDLETMAVKALSAAVVDANNRGVPIHSCQTTILSFFPELFNERHTVMAIVARKATEKSNTVIVVNTQHLDGIISQWDSPAAAATTNSIDDILKSPNIPVETQLQSRALLLALFKLTNAFSLDAVTDFPRALTESEVLTMRDHVKTYSHVFQTKGLEVLCRDPNDPRMKLNPLIGIANLMRVMIQLEMDPNNKEGTEESR